MFSQQSAFNDIGFAKCKEVFSTTNQGQVWIITPVYILFWKEWKLDAFFDLRFFFANSSSLFSSNAMPISKMIFYEPWPRPLFSVENFKGQSILKANC